MWRLTRHCLPCVSARSRKRFLRRPGAPKARCDQGETSSRFRLLFAHDLFGKPLRTFPDHALAQRTALRPEPLVEQLDIDEPARVAALAELARALERLDLEADDAALD